MPVSTGREAQITQVGDCRLFVGWRSDPFFFDVMGTLNNFQFTGEDFFADKDICSIVLEVPNSALGPKEVGLWGRTLIPENECGRRMGPGRSRRYGPTKLPFLANGTNRNDAYLAGEPAGDARFVPVFAHELRQGHTGGYGPEEALPGGREAI